MRLVLMVLGVLLVGPLAAETIGSVEYNLPNGGQGWKIEKEFQGGDERLYRTVVYLPEERSQQDALEFFAAHFNNLSVDIRDAATLAKEIAQGMALKFPECKATVTVLEQDAESIVYEWSLTSSDVEKAHGWSRAFSMPNETVLLNYQTEQLAKLDDLRPIWIQTLKDAKIVR